MNKADDDVMTVLLAEFKEQKAEQRDRIRWRDGLVHASVVIEVVLAGAVFGGKGPPVLLLVLPLVGFLLGQNYLANDIKIVEIRRDIKTRIAPTLKSMLAESQYAEKLLGWESSLSERRSLRKVASQLIGHLVAFAVLPAGGVLWFAALPAHVTGPQAVLAAVGLLLLVFLSAELVLASGIRPARYF